MLFRSEMSHKAKEISHNTKEIRHNIAEISHNIIEMSHNTKEMFLESSKGSKVDEISLVTVHRAKEIRPQTLTYQVHG